MSLLRNVVIGLAAGLFFALLYVAGVLGLLEDRIYDFFLRGRPGRERIDNVVFLDVDDAAIAYNGIYPWPRSVIADGFLRLKEYGAAAVILDIEFIDKGPEGIDTVYLNRDFPVDFERTFYNVSAGVSDLLGALRSGRINESEAQKYEGELLSFIREEKTGLFQKTLGIARDNDVYLTQASALLGRTWATLNLQTDSLSGEQAERRSLAEEKFAYPVDAVSDAWGGDFVDLLPAFPSFAQVARGAGFTNVDIDGDGVRRRIYLVQNIHDYWYLQLAFAPLMEYLGNPEIRLEKRRLILKNVRFPAEAAGAGSGSVRDVTIPLDTRGRMMLDWPRTDYLDSFKPHVSFADFSLLDELESQMDQYLTGLENTGLSFFAQFDESLFPAAGIVYRINALFGDAREARSLALAECSDDAFNRYLELRSEAMDLTRSFEELEPGLRVRVLAEVLERDYPEDAAAIRDEAEYIAMLAEYLHTVREQYGVIQTRLRESFEGKFCIIGRVDTGTTDIGVNPFYKEYVNVGTHAVVLDTILRESFIVPLSPLWSAVFCVVLAILFMLVLGGLKPVPRTGLGVGAAIFVGAVCFVIFRYTGIFIGPLGPVLAVLVAVIVRELVSYVFSEREKQFINKALSTYVSKEVVEELVANPSLLQLGGSKRQMSAIFTDIQSFSTISEQLDPEQLVQMLNRYLTVMSDIIMENMGTIDKYEGDAIVAFFGAPVHRADHAILACRSAVQMKKAELELNRELIEQGLITDGIFEALKNKGVRLDPDVPVPLYTRIGVNTGEMVVGNMGTSNKMNYTIMGNAVNLAARLEGVNKQYHTGGIMISEYTRNELGDEFICRSLDRVRVVGINTPVRLYEVLGLRSEVGAAGLEAFARWEKALVLYETGEFQAAQKAFSSLALENEKDDVARFYVDLCRGYSAVPPPAGWSGINNLSEK
ncbi:MAG: adenylate/guanylate cyclase domain-containing protein [Treponema sp.]|jgi:adenylate cyclase|nr:adenylate/guanylate cyclase domain-containing protein [Treponema sp.]